MKNTMLAILVLPTVSAISAFGAEPPRVPLQGAHSVKCEGVTYDRGIPASFAFTEDAKLGALTLTSQVGNEAPVVIVIKGASAKVSAIDLYGTGENLEFSGEVLAPFKVPPYTKPPFCGRCPDSHPGYVVMRAVQGAYVSLYKAFPYTAPDYTSGNVSYFLPGGVKGSYGLKDAKCEIQAAGT